MRLPAGNYVEHYLRYAERTVEDYSNDEIEGVLDESEKALAAHFPLQRKEGWQICVCQKRQKEI